MSGLDNVPVTFLHMIAIDLMSLANRRWMSAPLTSRRASPVIAILLLASMINRISVRMYGPVLYPLFEFMYNVPSHGLPYPNYDLYRYGASALAAAANSGSHLSPFANSFSLLYSNSSLVSVAYSALGAATTPISPRPPYSRT